VTVREKLTKNVLTPSDCALPTAHEAVEGIVGAFGGAGLAAGGFGDLAD